MLRSSRVAFGDDDTSKSLPEEGHVQRHTTFCTATVASEKERPRVVPLKAPRCSNWCSFVELDIGGSEGRLRCLELCTEPVLTRDNLVSGHHEGLGRLERPGMATTSLTSSG